MCASAAGTSLDGSAHSAYAHVSSECAHELVFGLAGNDLAQLVQPGADARLHPAERLVRRRDGLPRA